LVQAASVIGDILTAMLCAASADLCNNTRPCCRHLATHSQSSVFIAFDKIRR
jgi:hypothetical protein